MKWLILTDKKEFWYDRAVSAFVNKAEKLGAECDVLPRISFDAEKERAANVDAMISISEFERQIPVSDVPGYAVSLSSGTIKRDGKIICEGVPIPERSDVRFDKTAARNFLVVPRGQKTVLISSSGMTAKNCLSLCNILSRSDDVVLWVFTDRESDLKDALRRVYVSDDKVQLITYTEKMNVYIKSADVMISRGGVPAAEAVTAGVPLVLFPFDEKHDEKLIKTESAVAAFGEEDAASKALRLLTVNALRERMINLQRRHAKHGAAEDAVLCIIQDTENK